MSAPTTVRAATQRLVVLTALRWLPVGLTVPVMVLLLQARGLSLADVGLLFTVYGAITLGLELPTGGLADVVGRRAVLAAGTSLHALSCLGFAVADDLTGFLLAIVPYGVGRALDSGPLEAWYVDTVSGLDLEADVAPGLAGQSAADGGGLAVGAVLGGLLPTLLGGGTAALAAPFLVAAALDLLHVGGVLALVSEDRPPRPGSARRALAAGLREVPATVAGVLRLSASDRPFRLVLLLTAVGGSGVVSYELLAPNRFAELAGGAAEGAAVLGTVQAASFAAAAAGALGGPPLRRRLAGSTRATCTVLAALGATGLALFGLADAVLLAAVAFGGFYVAHGAAWPLLSTVLHGRVTARNRSTAVSAMALAMGLGGITANLLLPHLADAAGLAAAFYAVAAGTLLSALLCLRLPRVPAGPPVTASPR